MSAITFDTHAYVKKLKAVGFTEEQAEVQVAVFSEVINEQLATKRDLKELEVQLIQSMKDMEYRLIMRLGGMIAASIAIIAALVKLL